MKQLITMLINERIKLKVVSFGGKDESKEWVDAYKFTITLPNDEVIGRCDLRIGHNRKTFIGGNIGYEIDEPYRGSHFSYDACLLMFELAKKHEMKYVIITCEKSNDASRKILELLNGHYLGLRRVEPFSEMHDEGIKEVHIYRYELI
jgi:tagatose 1,6-diphosphate aldolase